MFRFPAALALTSALASCQHSGESAGPVTSSPISGPAAPAAISPAAGGPAAGGTSPVNSALCGRIVLATEANHRELVDASRARREALYEQNNALYRQWFAEDCDEES